MLFTPPCCPDLQPSELFWAAGKNHARKKHPGHTRSVKQTVLDLWEGWYGNGSKAAADCRGMFKEMLKCADERVALDSFLDGTIDGGLKVVGGDEDASMSKFPRSTVQAQNPSEQRDLFDPEVNGSAALGSDAEDSDSGSGGSSGSDSDSN